MKNALQPAAFGLLLIVGVLADGLMDSYGEIGFICVAGAALVFAAGLLLTSYFMERR